MHLLRATLLVTVAAVLLSTPTALADEPVSPDELSYDPNDWMAFQLEGVHPFVGISGAPGLAGHWIYDVRFDTEAAAFFSVRGGVLFDRVELAVELAPLTFWPELDEPGLLSFAFTIGGFPELTDGVYWPLRFGIGLAAIHTRDKEVWLAARAVLIGIAFKVGHLLLEVDLPSVRFTSDIEDFGVWGWTFDVSASYVF